jgi:hypothetical protein
MPAPARIVHCACATVLVLELQRRGNPCFVMAQTRHSIAFSRAIWTKKRSHTNSSSNVIPNSQSTQLNI